MFFVFDLVIGCILSDVTLGLIRSCRKKIFVLVSLGFVCVLGFVLVSETGDL
jgi:hypothetical protein